MNETIGGAPQEQAAVSNTRNKKRRKLHIKGNIFPVVAWTAVALWCLIFLGLLFWAFINSLKTYINFYEAPLFFPTPGGSAQDCGQSARIPSGQDHPAEI